MKNETCKNAIRRLAAFATDYCVIAIYIGALIFVNVGLIGTSLESSSDLASKIQGHLIAFVTLTLPVWLYLTLSEAGSRAATLGKRVLKLQIKTISGGTASFAQIALRNALKLLPWEVAHAAIWYVPGQPFIDPMPMLNLSLCVFANLLMLGYAVMLFINTGRTPYDRFSGLVVTRISEVR